VTFFGLMLTPLFYLLVRKYLRGRRKTEAAEAAPLAQVVHSH
jgi:hypothetical protein